MRQIKVPKPPRGRVLPSAVEGRRQRLRAVSNEILELQERIAELAPERRKLFNQLRWEDKLSLAVIARDAGVSRQTVLQQTQQQPPAQLPDAC